MHKFNGYELLALFDDLHGLLQRDFGVRPHNVGCIEDTALIRFHQNRLQNFWINSFIPKFILWLKSKVLRCLHVSDWMLPSLTCDILNSGHRVIQISEKYIFGQHRLMILRGSFNLQPVQQGPNGNSLDENSKKYYGNCRGNKHGFGSDGRGHRHRQTEGDGTPESPIGENELVDQSKLLCSKLI